MVEPSPPTLERAYRVRLRPTPAQALMLRRIFGARRAVWNWALAEQAAARARGEKRPGLTTLSAAFTTRRSSGETAWLSQLPREPYNQTLRDLEAAWSRFLHRSEPATDPQALRHGERGPIHAGPTPGLSGYR